jgi:hypothetical protein
VFVTTKVRLDKLCAMLTVRKDWAFHFASWRK